MANTRNRNKKTKRTATKRRSLRGIRGNKGSSDFMTDLKEAAFGVGATTGGVMAAHGVVHNLLTKDGNYIMSPKDKTTQTPDNKTGGLITGLVVALGATVGLTQVENPYLRDALKGAAAVGLEIGITSKMTELKESLGLKGVDAAAENEYDGSPEDSIDWESIAAEAMQEVKGVDDDGDDDDDDDDDSSEYEDE